MFTRTSLLDVLMIGVDCDVYDGCGQTSGCSLGHDQIDLGRAILLLNFPTSRCHRSWITIELLFRQFSCHTTTAHDSQILRNQLAHILRNQLARIQEINWLAFNKSIGLYLRNQLAYILNKLASQARKVC